MMKDKKYKISVVVTTFNHANYIKQCLDGILMQQTNFLFEIILGEDESNDATREICIDYAKRYPEKIKLFLRSRKDVIYINGNPSGRYNFMENLKACTGKYIALCEGDDYWTDPLKLQKQVDFLEANKDYALCFHNVNRIDIRRGTHSISPMIDNLKKDSFTTTDIISQWFIPTTSILFRQYKDFEFPSWFKYCASGDIPLLLLLSLEGKFKYLNEIMACYRKHELGLSVDHIGYFKVFSMIYIYQNFNIHTNFKYAKKINEEMINETREYLPEIMELNKLKRENLKIKKLLLVRMYNKIKKIFNN